MKRTIVFAYIALIAGSPSCKKNSTGGDATIATIVKHHDRPIPFSTVYIKYGAKEFAGADVSKYDASQITDEEGNTRFEKLRQGDYYFYSVGYDSVAQSIVTGGVGLQIRRHERKQKFELNVPVTE